MSFQQFNFEQKIGVSSKNLWEFISNPANLKLITPDSMQFQVTNHELASKIYAGMIITYKVKPILGIPMTWMTEITQVKENEYFVDEQRIGPYKFWHHQHILIPIDGGVLMKDLITYIPPMGIIGQMTNSLFIKAKVNQIFEYRREAIKQNFNQLEK